MTNARFLYVTYIKTTQQKLWEALTDPEFNRAYWFGAHQESSWEKGAPWRLVAENGTVLDTGEVLEIDPPRRLVLKWRNEFRPELRADGFTRATFTLEAEHDAVKLTVLHEADTPEHRAIGAVSNGWPQVLSSLKSLLETGAPLNRPSIRPGA